MLLPENTMLKETKYLSVLFMLKAIQPTISLTYADSVSLMASQFLTEPLTQCGQQ